MKNPRQSRSHPRRPSAGDVDTNYRTVLLFMTVVIVFAVMIGLIYNP